MEDVLTGTTILPKPRPTFFKGLANAHCVFIPTLNATATEVMVKPRQY